MKYVHTLKIPFPRSRARGAGREGSPKKHLKKAVKYERARTPHALFNVELSLESFAYRIDF